MELWIRSQDKMVLRKIDNLYIAQTLYQTENGGYSIKYEGQNESIYTLGEYQTKERALEVLDEIQNILKPKTIVLKDLNKLNEEEMNQFKNLLSIIPPVNSIQELPTYVYEMPEE